MKRLEKITFKLGTNKRSKRPDPVDPKKELLQLIEKFNGGKRQKMKIDLTDDIVHKWERLQVNYHFGSALLFKKQDGKVIKRLNEVLLSSQFEMNRKRGNKGVMEPSRMFIEFSFNEFHYLKKAGFTMPFFSFAFDLSKGALTKAYQRKLKETQY